MSKLPGVMDYLALQQSVYLKSCCLPPHESQEIHYRGEKCPLCHEIEINGELTIENARLQQMLANSTYDEDPPRQGYVKLGSDTYWERYGQLVPKLSK
jgi:hypothetical protein